jgi:GDP-mannose 6-dehydrogenase
MNISIFGLGYVGAVSAACLAAAGHSVIGVDSNRTKVDLINSGTAPIVEERVGEMIAQARDQALLSATTSVADAVRLTSLSIVCVGTPSQLNGNLDLSFVRRVCEEIGTALRDKTEFHVVVIRSTILPGSMRNVVIPVLEAASGKIAGKQFGVCNNPEFLREGTAVFDYNHPPKTVIGETDSLAGDILLELYSGFDAPLVRTTIEVAEMVKYVDNSWHALKVSFANEIGSLCKALGLDSHRVMDIFCQDTKLNLSAYYLKPGFAFGGSCLPKDVRALNYTAKSLDLSLAVLNAILPSNERQIQSAFEMIVDTGKHRIGILGFAFKAGTDDLRESPLVNIIERLIGKGYEVRVYDRNVRVASLSGANRDYILNHIPHISRLMMDSAQEVAEFAETLVIGNGAAEFRNIMEETRADQIVIDLVRLGGKTSYPCDYRGISW